MPVASTPKKNKISNEQKIKARSLERSLYQVITIACCMALFLAYLAFIINDRYTQRRSLISYVTILAEVTAQNSVGPVSFQEDESAREVLRALRIYSHIRHAVILTVENVPFVEFRNNWKEASKARVLGEEVRFNQNSLEISRAINLGSKPVGYLYLLVDLEEEKERLIRIIGIGGLILLLALMAAIILSQRLMNTVSKPIYDLVALVERVGRDRDYSCRAEVCSIKELNILVFSINGMFAEIQKRDTELIKNSKKLHRLANFDLLTQLPNRLMFMDRIDRAVRTARRHKTLIAVLFIDLDKFKQINDTLGHKAGDALLQEVGRRLSCNVREIDTVARLAGDEFTVILEDIKENRNAEIVAKKILNAFNAEFTFEGKSISVGASIGISVYPHDARNVETLIHHSDAAMYFAKNHGRNIFEFYDPKFNIEANRRSLIETELHLELKQEQGHLKLFYQPKFDANNLTIVGVEALLRWQHPSLGSIPPIEFIPIAETSHLIRELGEWVLRRACRQLKQWHIMGYTQLTVA